MAVPLQAPPPTPVHDADEVRRLADEILSRPELQPPGRSVVERVLDWIARQLERFFGFGDGDGGIAFDPGGGGAGGSAAFTAVVLVLALVVAAVVVAALRGTWRRRTRPADGEPAVDVEEHRSAAAWDALAARLEADGRWKEGLRARFGALVERLAERGVVAHGPARTSGEYRADVAASLPEAAGSFAELTDLFERAWYGDLPTGAPESARFAAAGDRVLAAAGDDR